MIYNPASRVFCKFNILVITFGLLLFSQSYSQSHRLRLGFEALYSRQISSKLFKDLKTSTAAFGDVPVEFSSSLANGYDLAFLVGGTIFEGFDLELNFGVRQAKTALERPKITKSNLALNMSYASLNLHVYPFYFKSFEKYFDYDFRRSFFFEFAVAYNAYQAQGSWQHTFNNQNQSGNISSAAPKFSYAVGIGYDFYVSDRLSISPYLRYNFIPRVRIDSVRNLIVPRGQNRVGPAQYNIAQLQVGIRLGITLIPMKKICPIIDCRVQKEHRHAHLGKRIVRGNKYNNKQYPLIGQNRHPNFLTRLLSAFSRRSKYPKQGPKKHSKK